MDILSLRKEERFRALDGQFHVEPSPTRNFTGSPSFKETWIFVPAHKYLSARLSCRTPPLQRKVEFVPSTRLTTSASPAPSASGDVGTNAEPDISSQSPLEADTADMLDLDMTPSTAWRSVISSLA
jgi:hypothetical protein